MWSAARELEIEAAWQTHTKPRYPHRGVLTADDRNRMAEAQNWRCCYCTCRMMGEGKADDAPTFEHLIPVWRGGSKDDPDNVIIACYKCNNTRGDMPLDRYLEKLQHAA